MNEQDKLEAQYRNEEITEDIPRNDPFPRMIIVCVGITMFLLVIIMGVLFIDFIVLRPQQNVRPAPVQARPAPVAPQAPEAPLKTGEDR